MTSPAEAAEEWYPSLVSGKQASPPPVVDRSFLNKTFDSSRRRRAAHGGRSCWSSSIRLILIDLRSSRRNSRLQPLQLMCTDFSVAK